MSQEMTVDFKALARAAAVLEQELGQRHHSHPLIFKAKRDLEFHVDQSMRIRRAKDALGMTSRDTVSQEILDLVRECWVMIECATLILHGP